MLRVIAFASGVTAGVALFLFVVLGVGYNDTHAAQARGTTAATATAQDSGQLVTRPTEPPSPFIAVGDDDPEDGAQLDIQSDEVTPAVARYRFDAQGNIYETHAPHTEVPKLGSPQT